MSDFEASSTGIDALIARLSVLPGVSKEGALQGMYELARDKVMPDSKENYCPFKFGYLRGSGVVYRDQDMVYLEYGSPQAIGPEKGAHPNEYAVEQHENLSYSHDPATGHGGGQAKYLEIPLEKWASALIEAAGQGVSNILEVSDWTTRYAFVSKIIDPDYAASFDAAMAGVATTHTPAPKFVPKNAPRLRKKGK